MIRLGETTRIALLGSAAALALTMASAANAQIQEQQAPPQQDQSATDQENQEIVITAQKREEKILDIPQSVTVVGGDTLERQHAVTFQDYLSQVPGLSLEQTEPGVGRLVLRGVNTGGVSSTVAVYVDETPFGSSTGLVNGAILAGDFDTFDVARIEVLRGPQGTLYGASSLGGVLKFVTNTPQLGQFEARARTGIEFVDGGGTGYNFNGVVNAPLGDEIAVRASGFYRKTAGWIDANEGTVTINDALGLGLSTDVPVVGGKNINEGQVWGGRGSILFKPTQNLKVRLTAIAQHIESNAPTYTEVDQETYEPINGKARQTRFFREPNELKYRLYNGVIEYDFGFASLLSSTSYNKSDQTFTADAVPVYGQGLSTLFGSLNPNLPPNIFPFPQLTTAFIAPFQDQQTDLSKFTQEVRLASPSNEKFEWMVGAYYTHEKGLIDQFLGSVDPATGEPFGIPPIDDLATLSLNSKYKEIAGFSNVTWHLTDRFDLTAGGRFAKNKQSAHQVSESALGLADNGQFTIKSDESVFTFAVSPRFEINDTTAVYGRIARGFRPGGPNVVPPRAPADVPRTFDSDTITSYEVGLKSDFGRFASLDISAYHLDWQDIQLFSFVGGFGINANGGTAVSNGIEGSLILRPARGLQLGLNGAYIDAHLTQDTPPLAGGFNGDRLPFVPKVSVSLNADYEWHVSNSATAFVGGTVAYVGNQRDNFNISDVVGFDNNGGAIYVFTPQRHIPDYATVDLRAGIEFDRFTLEAYVKNLTNTEGVSSLNLLEDQVLGAGNILPGNAIRAALSRPRTIGLSLSAGF